MAKDSYQLTDEQKELASKLTHLQRLTVLNNVKGSMSSRAAYFAAGGKSKGASADAIVSRMLSTAKVKAFYNSLVESAASESVMTRAEALATLSNIARTNVKDVVTFKDSKVGEDDDGNPIYQTTWQLKDHDSLEDKHAASIAELSTSKDGFKFKLNSQTEAIKQLANLEGWDSPKKIEGNVTLDGKVDSPEVASALTSLLEKL